VVDLKPGATVAYEALARWQHPSGHVDDPRQFVQVAEDRDLIVKLDLAVIQQPCTTRAAGNETTPRCG
jgi:EAL domain-containing protein (putative c-di-GMP-specific phosphodiesterase class I)